MKKSLRRERDDEERTTPTGRQKNEKTIGTREIRKHVRLHKLPDHVIEWLLRQRPKTRGECRGGVRPCPFISCPYHLYLDVNPRTGSIKLNFPGKEIWELAETCSLDIAERGASTLEEIGGHMNITRERVRQLEASAMKKLKAALEELQNAK